MSKQNIRVWEPEEKTLYVPCILGADEKTRRHVLEDMAERIYELFHTAPRKEIFVGFVGCDLENGTLYQDEALGYLHQDAGVDIVHSGRFFYESIPVSEGELEECKYARVKKAVMYAEKHNMRIVFCVGWTSVWKLRGILKTQLGKTTCKALVTNGVVVIRDAR